jgi:DNA-binding CsgD family transcriptional regulator
VKRRYNTPSTRDPLGLTPRQRACADMLVAGATTAQMAAALGVTADAVLHHLSRLYRKLGVDCAAYALDALRDLQSVHELSEPFADEADPRGLPYAGYETGVASE